MGTREILTLQFGHYANFVGTHWWNLQEAQFEYSAENLAEINHDVLFREGQTTKGQVTFTPRLLLVDLKGSLKALPQEGSLYDDFNEHSNLEGINWDPSKVELQQSSKEPKNQFQQDLETTVEPSGVLNKNYNLENDVIVWSDYCYTRFHPRTVNVVKEYQHCNADTPFDVFPLGQTLWKTAQFEDEFCDKIRNYVEECDSFQGFQILSDVTNGFSGLSSGCLEYLQDEYDQKSVLVFPVIPSFFHDNDFSTDTERHQSILNDSIRTLNLALSFNSFSRNCSLFVPLCAGLKGWRQPGPKREFYHTVYDHRLPYHSSAILAAALDTFTLKHRLKSGEGFSLIDLSKDLSCYGRKAAAASLCLPFSLNKDADLIDCLNNWEGPLSQSITPSCNIGTERMMQHITLRGINEDRLKRPHHLAQKQADLPAYKTKNIHEMLTYYLSCTTYATASNVTVSHKALPVKTPYPQIFDKAIGTNGNVFADSRPDNSRVESVPVLAGLHNGPGVGEMLESLHTEAKKIKFQRFHSFITGGIDQDEFTECLDSLFDLRENYEDSYLV